MMFYGQHYSDGTLKRYFFCAIAVALSLKVVVASQLQLFGDEAFYWWEAQHPAAAYSDLPFATSALVSLGTSILGDSFLGVRLFFLLLGGLLPVAVFLLAHPIVGKRDACWAALASLILPMGGTLGLLAIPSWGESALLIFDGLWFKVRFIDPACWKPLIATHVTLIKVVCAFAGVRVIVENVTLTKHSWVTL